MFWRPEPRCVANTSHQNTGTTKKIKFQSNVKEHETALYAHLKVKILGNVRKAWIHQYTADLEQKGLKCDDSVCRGL